MASFRGVKGRRSRCFFGPYDQWNLLQDASRRLAFGLNAVQRFDGVQAMYGPMLSRFSHVPAATSRGAQVVPALRAAGVRDGWLTCGLILGMWTGHVYIR